MKNKTFEIINYVFFGLVIIASFILTLVFNLGWLTFVSCAFGIFYVVFLSERNILNFFVGFVSTSTYIVISYQARLYGEAIFYLVVDLPMIIISFVLWLKHMETKFKVKSNHLSKKSIAIISTVSVIFVVLYGFFLKIIGGTNTFVDALSTVVTCTATILMALRYKEQWVMWIIVYAVSIVLWSTTFNLLMLIMSISCFISSIVGFVNWNKSTKENLENKKEDN